MSLSQCFRIGTMATMLSLGAWPVQAALTWQLSTVESAGDVGQHTSIALDASGNPVISYYDSANGDLKLVHCGDATCSTGDSIQTVDSVGTVGQYNSLKLDRNGFPVISYYDATNADLKLVHCGNADCSSGNSIQTVDSTGTVGLYTSLALDAAGNPVIAYSGSGLKVAHCGDANCSGGNSIQVTDAGGSGISLVLDGDGKPVVSFVVPVPKSPTAPASGILKLLRCGDINCSGGNVAQTLDSTIGPAGSNTSLALDNASGTPVVAYYDSLNADLKLVRCGDAGCSSGNVVQVVDGLGQVGEYASLALGATATRSSATSSEAAG
jgi:hypothetical protein